MQGIAISRKSRQQPCGALALAMNTLNDRQCHPSRLGLNHLQQCCGPTAPRLLTVAGGSPSSTERGDLPSPGRSSQSAHRPSPAGLPQRETPSSNIANAQPYSPGPARAEAKATPAMSVGWRARPEACTAAHGNRLSGPGVNGMRTKANNRTAEVKSSRSPEIKCRELLVACCSSPSEGVVQRCR